MTVRTNLLVKLLTGFHGLSTIAQVAFFTDHRAAIVIAGVKHQAETGRGGMLKLFPVPFGWCPG